MDFGDVGGVSYGVAGRTGADAGSEKPELSDPEEKTLIEVIREKGFTQFLKELEQQKMENLRKKILGAMGLSEEDLESMPADQRAEIEEMVARKIVQRLAANAELDGSTTAVLFQKTKINIQISELSATASIASNMGLGPLLALQESQAVEAQNISEKDRETG